VTAQFLAVLLLIPYLVGGLAVRPASAQADQTDVIVMDFNNRSSVGGPLIGRSAAAALAIELANSDRWNPVAETTVNTALQQLNLRPPFDTIALTRLAQRVDARAVIVGEVVSVRIAENPAQATVTLAMQIMDRSSQEMINGAVVTGRSAPRIGYTGDTSVLIDEALSNAAFQAVQAATRYQIVEGTVMNTSVVGENFEALINIGARQGVKDGMRFIVQRRGELVARGRARSVDPDFSTLAVSDNYRGVQPEDRVRATFTLPPLPRDVSEAEGDRTVALVQQETPEQPRPGDVVVPDVTPTSRERKPSMGRGARLLAGGLVVLGLVGLAGRRGGTRVFNTEAEPVQLGTETAIRVRWSRPREVSSEDVIQYQVVRTAVAQGTCAVAVVVGDTREFLDGTSATAAQRNLGSIQTGSTGGTGGGTGGTVGSGIAACADADLPIVPGRTYTYNVQAVFLIPVDPTGGGGGGGGTTGPTVGISQPSTPSDPVTALAVATPVTPANGATGVDLTAVDFQFTSVAGANLYVVQVSTDASFRSGVADVATVPNPSQAAGQTLATGPVNLQARFGGRTQLFWRVGARNTQASNGFVFGVGSSFVPAGATP